MITISVKINDQEVVLVHAINTGIVESLKDISEGNLCEYRILGDGTRLYHDRRDGAAVLASKILNIFVG